MSINQELPSDTLWWTQQQQHHHNHTPIMEQTDPANTPFHQRRNTHNTPLSFNLNQETETEEMDKDQEESVEQVVYVQKDSMFEKPLTPSDVGKLNRLVIPKQHAEKYFPLGANGGGESVEKGLLLSFEDESGKTWRFRYSYWNSSQSYVLTKGWSRFVKEKRLDAGDVVVFERSRNESDRFFVGWRRRNATTPQPETTVPQSGSSGGGAGWTRVYYSGYPYPTVVSNGQAVANYQPHCLHAPGGGGLGGMQNQTTAGGGNSKTVRLFGVNLECQSDEPADVGADGSNQSEDQAQTQVHHQHYNYSNGGGAHASKHHSSLHMDINFSRDVNQMGFYQG